MHRLCPRLARLLLFAVFLPGTHASAQPQAAAPPPDTSPHTINFVDVQPGVTLEVLDWGGTGRPLIFLSGLGSTAHDFDTFVPNFTAHNHVYAITRRGFGASSKPEPTVANYSADRLGDDILAVIAALHLNRPVLVGHSIAGEELSSIGTRHPEKVSGLIYLDAALSFAYYDPANSDMTLDMLEVNRSIDALKAGATFDRQYVQSLSTSVARLDKDLQQQSAMMAKFPPSSRGAPPQPGPAIMFGEQEYRDIRAPILALFACPQNFDFIRDNPALKAAMIADIDARCHAQARALHAGIPAAHIVLIPNSDHNIYHSNEAEVVREMNAFLATLP
jgi:pimeloyl-ACP methyl ester carboxylesterase